MLKGHFTAAETTYSYYKFNGKKYDESKCLMEILFHERRKTLIYEL